VNEKVLRYISACEYACELLGVETAEKYFDRLYRLAEVNSKEELESIVRGWRQPDAAPTPQPIPGDWAIGSRWGDSVRLVHDRGIVWRLRCPCGEMFTASTNDTTPERERKCSTCQLREDLSETVAKLSAIAQTVLEWHRDYDKVVWSRCWKACRKRGVTDSDFVRELHAFSWAKIAAVAGQYSEGNIGGWIATVTTNCVRDYFKVTDNRERLAPTVLLIEDSRETAAPPTRCEEVLPAKPVRPFGADPGDGALNERETAWDVKWKLA
jgi:hypothetical protein